MNPLIKNALKNIDIIININDYIKQKRFLLLPNKMSDFQPHWTKNLDASIIKNDLENNYSIDSIDKFLAFWIFECSINATFPSNQIEFKKNVLSDGIAPFLNFEDDIFNDFLKKLEVERVKYKYEKATLIITAICIEFISVVRKISIILNSSNPSLIEYIINPKHSKKEKEIMKNGEVVWIEGVIIKNNRFVNVRVVLSDGYGNTNVLDTLHKTDIKSLKNELVLVGIAGHLDKTNKVKIGHIVISDGFFSVNLFKDAEKEVIVNDEIIFKDVFIVKDKSKKAENSKESYCLDFENWLPTQLLTSLPEQIKDSISITNLNDIEVCYGSFVTGPSVVKQKNKKSILQDIFPNAKAVEMEAEGCFTFSKDKNMQLKIIKSIVDFSDGGKNDDWHSFGADLAAEFTVDYLIAKYGKDIKD